MRKRWILQVTSGGGKLAFNNKIKPLNIRLDWDEGRSLGYNPILQLKGTRFTVLNKKKRLKAEQYILKTIEK